MQNLLKAVIFKALKTENVKQIDMTAVVGSINRDQLVYLHY